MHIKQNSPQLNAAKTTELQTVTKLQNEQNYRDKHFTEFIIHMYLY